jgi:cell division protein DivIC
MEETSKNNNLQRPLLWRGLGRLPSWLKNKYLLAGAAFLVWIVFLDNKNDLFSQYDRLTHSRELTKNEDHLSNQIGETQKELDLLKNNAQSIEKYAREKYMMKKDNEDLFILNPAPESK